MRGGERAGCHRETVSGARERAGEIEGPGAPGADRCRTYRRDRTHTGW